MSKFLTQNLNFQGHLSTFGAQNTPKSRLFEAKNKAQTLPKQVQNNFEKVDFHPKIRPVRPSARPPVRPTREIKVTVRRGVKNHNQ